MDIKTISIGETPILDEEDYIEFLKKVEEGLKHPTGLVPTPKIEEARKLIKEHRMEKFWNENKERLEHLNEIRTIIFIKNAINGIDFNCTLDDAEEIIINLISEIFNKIYKNKDLMPIVETELDYNEGLVTTTITTSKNNWYHIYTQL